MKMVKSLILGSAAGLVAMSGAQAADLPVKAKAVEYVRICSLYGAGFFYIPGTDTCIKLGGYLRVDTTFNGGIYGAAVLVGRCRPGQSLQRLLHFPFPYGADGRYPHRHRIRRCPYLRSGRLPVRQLRQPPTRPRSSAFPGWRFQRAVNTAGGGYVAVEMVFIQFAGFTFGKSASALRDALARLSGQQQLVPAGRPRTPSPASTTSSTPRSSATACRAPSVSMIRPCSTVPPC